MSFFQTHNLKVGYSGKVVVDNVEINLGKGEILCLLGPNGSGKSTIIKTIIDNLNIISGKITYLNQDMEKLSLIDRAKNMSIVLTERVEPEIMTAENIVATGRYPYTNHFGRLSKEDLDIIEESISIVNGEKLKDKKFSRLSDGEKQRIMIARAICQESDIMVLDEPTSYLDIRYKVELLNILNKLSEEKNKTIIMSLHEIDLVTKIADKVLLIHNGRVYKYGTPEEVITDKNIETVYDLDKGMFNSSVGMLELTKEDKNETDVFVLGREGKGIPIYRALNRNNISFDSGVIFRNDMDYNTAKPLSEKIIVSDSFREISNSTLKSAKQRIDRVKYIIDSGVSLFGINSKNIELLKYANKTNKIIFSLREEDLDMKGIKKKKNITEIIREIERNSR